MRTTGIIFPIIALSLNHIAKLILNKKYRNYHKIAGNMAAKKRFVSGTVFTDGFKIEYVDAPSFLSAYKDIFFNQVYEFNADRKDLYIIDCGANIGLATLFLKQFFPGSEIVAFEPDKKIFDCLKRNVEANSLINVTLQNKAVWYCNTKLKFIPDNADGGRLAVGTNDPNLTTVEAIDLKDYCNRSIDLLKIDIEGAEWDVLLNCKDCLKNVKRLFVEYHSAIGKEQKLPELLNVIKAAGFRLNIKSRNDSFAPFLKSAEYEGFDLHLDIYCTKEKI